MNSTMVTSAQCTVWIGRKTLFRRQKEQSQLNNVVYLSMRSGQNAGLIQFLIAEDGQNRLLFLV